MDKDVKKCTDRVTDGQGHEYANELVVSINGGMVVNVAWQGISTIERLKPNVIVVDHDNKCEDGKTVNPFEWLSPKDPGVFVLYVNELPTFASRDFEEIDGELDKLPHGISGDSYRIGFCSGLDFIPNINELRHMVMTNDERLDE